MPYPRLALDRVQSSCACALAGGLLLAGCGSNETPTSSGPAGSPVSGGSIVYGTDREPSSSTRTIWAICRKRTSRGSTSTPWSLSGPTARGAVACRFLDDLAGRSDLHIQDQTRRQVPRRHANLGDIVEVPGMSVLDDGVVSPRVQ